MKYLNPFIDAMFGKLDRTGLAWARVGIIVLIVAAAMSFDFGTQVSLKHGLFLAALSFAAAFGPEVAYKMWEEKRMATGGVLGVAAAFLLCIEFFTHHAYTAGIRGHNVTETKVQNVKYEGAQEDVESAQRNLKLWTKMLEDLQGQNAWAATVKAEALRTELAALKDRMTKEEQGQRGRKAGRGKEFEKLQDQVNALTARISTVEKVEDLTTKIEAAKRLVEKNRFAANTTEHKSSPVVHSNESLAKIVAFFGQGGNTQPSDTIKVGADMSANLAMAVAGTGLPAFCLFIAGLYRIRDKDGNPLKSEFPVMDAQHAVPSDSISDKFADAFAAKFGIAA